MAELITIWFLVAGGAAVFAVIARALGCEFKGDYRPESDRKKGWDPSENHDFGHTMHWSDHSHHHDHGSSF